MKKPETAARPSTRTKGKLKKNSVGDGGPGNTKKAVRKTALARVAEEGSLVESEANPTRTSASGVLVS